MTELDQSYLTDRSDSTVTVQTTGTVIRPPLFIASAFADESRWQFTSDGLRVAAVDAVNVGMFDIEIPASAFDQYDVDGSEIGFKHKDLRKSLNMARHGAGTQDPVRVDVQDGQATVAVERAFNETDVDHRQTFLTLDTDTIRQTPTLPGLDLPNHATLDTKAFKQVADGLNGRSATAVGGEDRLVFREIRDGEEANRTSYTEFDAKASIAEPDAASLMNDGYLQNVADAIYRAHIDTVTLRWGDKFPVKFEFERQIEEKTVLDGTIMVAPRIKSDD